MADRTLPHNTEAELNLLGALLQDNSQADEVAAILTEEDFYHDDHRELYATIRAILDDGIPANTVSVGERLGLEDRWAELTCRAILSVPHAYNARYCAGVIRNNGRARRMIEALSESLDEAYRFAEHVDGLLDRAEGRLLAIRETQAENLTTGEGAMIEAGTRIWQREAGGSLGLSTGLYGLDGYLIGMQPGQLLVLAARPSIGKTAMALGITSFAATAANEGVLFASLEMGRVELADRLIAMRAMVPGACVRMGRFGAMERRAVEKVLVRSGEYRRLHIDDTPMQTVSRITSTARRIKRRHGLGLVVVDYLQLLQPPADVPRRASQQEQVTAISARLKGMARELQVPVLALSQLNRQAEARTDKRPMLADLRMSGAIEQDADVVMLLHRPEFYNPDDQPGEAELHVAKNRNGQTGTVKLRYEKQFTLFSDPEA